VLAVAPYVILTVNNLERCFRPEMVSAWSTDWSAVALYGALDI